jgi:hypothetical protein
MSYLSIGILHEKCFYRNFKPGNRSWGLIIYTRIHHLVKKKKDKNIILDSTGKLEDILPEKEKSSPHIHTDSGASRHTEGAQSGAI